MEIIDASARLVACLLTCFVALAAIWILLEHVWERAWDALDRLRVRIRTARLAAEYQTVARRHGRVVNP